jgi:exodeoxyribonuclease VII large subunit
MREIRTVSVSELNNYVRRVLENNSYLKDIVVKGEVSNLTRHASGHIYFTLKDAGGALRAVMFKSAAQGLRFRPENGMKLLARGRVSVYEAGGQYQLYVEALRPDGVGALYEAYEQLKKRLEAEGLFAPERKKPLPRLPQTVGIVTAPTGAAIRDILNILKRRYPLGKAVLYPTLVQGEKAAAQIAEAIRYFSEKNLADVLIIGRGGGSIEDLWAFNEEVVARAVAASQIPVISAVGHETDFTVADFAADLRAPTPSAAAELAAPSLASLSEGLAQTRRGLRRALERSFQARGAALALLCARVDFSNLSAKLSAKKQQTDFLIVRIQNAVSAILFKKQAAFRREAARLDALSPLKALARGYAVVAKDGVAVRSAAQIEKGDALSIRLADGTVAARAEHA